MNNPARDLGYCCACGALKLTGSPRAVHGKRIACLTAACEHLATVMTGWVLDARDARDLLHADVALLRRVGARNVDPEFPQPRQHAAA